VLAQSVEARRNPTTLVDLRIAKQTVHSLQPARTGCPAPPGGEHHPTKKAKSDGTNLDAASSGLGLM